MAYRLAKPHFDYRCLVRLLYNPRPKENEELIKNRILIVFVVCAMLVAGACSKAANTNTNSNTANKNTAAPSPSPAASASARSQTDAVTGEGKQDFTVHNQTGVIIDKLFVSPNDKDDWQEDILGKDTLPNGESLDIVFNPKEKAAKWDLKIEDSEGNSIEWHDLNLMEISEVTLHYDGKNGTAEVK
jgi:hypothetical protein